MHGDPATSNRQPVIKIAHALTPILCYVISQNTASTEQVGFRAFWVLEPFFVLQILYCHSYVGDTLFPPAARYCFDRACGNRPARLFGVRAVGEPDLRNSGAGSDSRITSLFTYLQGVDAA